MQTYSYAPPRIGKTQYEKAPTVKRKEGFLQRKRQKMKQQRGHSNA